MAQDLEYMTWKLIEKYRKWVLKGDISEKKYIYVGGIKQNLHSNMGRRWSSIQIENERMRPLETETLKAKRQLLY